MKMNLKCTFKKNLKVSLNKFFGPEVGNALAAIAASKHVGIPSDKSISALGKFKNVKKRMELLESTRGINIYDDFAHHPTAIKTTLEGLRSKIGKDRIVAIIEPRSNTMKLGKMKDDLLKSLKEADIYLSGFSRNLSWDPKILLTKYFLTRVF